MLNSCSELIIGFLLLHIDLGRFILFWRSSKVVGVDSRGAPASFFKATLGFHAPKLLQSSWILSHGTIDLFCISAVFLFWSLILWRHPWPYAGSFVLLCPIRSPPPATNQSLTEESSRMLVLICFRGPFWGLFEALFLFSKWLSWSGKILKLTSFPLVPLKGLKQHFFRLFFPF